jgi:phosphatidylserine/phosphatidylglycerophosphate/cardiolipin synthase-like enzyme
MKVFISYRRQDSTVITGRIYDRLTSAFGERTIFRDIDDIPAGKDFRAVLENEVSKSDIMLVIIGSQWAGITDANGNKRLSDPNDFVRIKVESGLRKKNILVIPVLVLGAPMPSANDLPETMQELIFRNAVNVRNDPDFSHDVGRLIRQIKKSGQGTQIFTPKLGIASAAILLMLFLIFAGIKLFGHSPEKDNPTANSTIPPIDSTTIATDGLSEISVGSGFGARANAWQLYFTNPANNPNPVAQLDVSKLIDKTINIARAVSMYEEPNGDSAIINRISTGSSFVIRSASDDKLWLYIQLEDQTVGWISTSDLLAVSADPIELPAKNSYGINIRLVDAIGKLTKTLDIAAYELDEKEITNAILEAFSNGVIVRIVTDDEYGLNNPDNSFQEFMDAGIPVVTDGRTSLMHDKFMILDGKTVWTGSWNYTTKGTYESHDNALAFDSKEVAAMYQHEFNQMFEKKEFSPQAPASPVNSVVDSNIPVSVFFSPHDNIDDGVLSVIQGAQKSIYFMTFVMTDDDFGNLFIERLNAGVKVKGIFEKLGSSSPVSELSRLFCAKADVRTDGSEYLLHHKVIIVDEAIVITGSANYSVNGMKSNNENTIVIQDPVLASVYMQEFERQWADAEIPTNIVCP